MSNSCGSQQAQTVANALTGERGFRDVRFAITGDRHADLIAGFKAIVDSESHPDPRDDTSQLRSRQKDLLLALEFITALAKNRLEVIDNAIADEKQRQEREHQLRRLGAGTYPRSDEKTWAAPWTTAAASMTASEVKAAADRMRADMDAKASDALSALQVDYDKIRAGLMAAAPLSKVSIPNEVSQALLDDLDKAP